MGSFWHPNGVAFPMYEKKVMRDRLEMVFHVTEHSSAASRREDENLSAHRGLVHRAVECEQPLFVEGEDVGGILQRGQEDIHEHG
jgi:hypothetical protein